MVHKNFGIRDDCLSTIKSTNPMYDRLLKYRIYSLKRTTRKRTGKVTTKITDHVNRIYITLKDHKFDGATP